jgi:carboxylesterase type B
MVKLNIFNPCVILQLICFAGLCIGSNECESSSEVLTTSGLVVGIPATAELPVVQFLSIPYASPPVGNLRFAPPQPFTFDGIIQATELPPYCVQPSNVTYSEDCLFLNIYVPQKSTVSPKPVMFWIHGGSFLTGGSSDPAFNGSFLAENEDVIVVTTNYRLGFLGFYDSAVTGTNFGLQDVIAALQWVQNNIAQFGGNPQQVTVFGESSGATMIRALLTSPRASNKFVRAILQSDPQNYDANYQNVSRGVLSPYLDQLVGCSSSSTQCLRSLPIDAILAAEINANITLLPGVNTIYPFGPNIDNEFISTRFGVAVEEGTLQNNVDIILGFVKDETASTLSVEFPQPINQQIYEEFLIYSFGEQGAQAIVESPLFSTEISPFINGGGYIQQLEVTGTEYDFSCPIQLNAGRLATKQQHFVYTYEFLEGIQYPDNVGAYLCEETGAVCHEDDLYLVFGTYPTTATSSQISLSNQIQARWAAFASTGNPNTGNFGGWAPAASLSNLNLFLLGNGTSVAEVDSAQCNFFETNDIPFSWEV